MQQAKRITKLQVLTKIDLDWIETNSVLTSVRCKQPGEKVINRKLVADFLRSKLGWPINHKIVNQLVLLVCPKLPRMRVSIQTRTRNRYILSSSQDGQKYSPVVLLIDYVLSHKELVNQAYQNYQLTSNLGKLHKGKRNDTST